jgi:hypothetical protein
MKNLKNLLREYQRNNSSTLLGIGPMSRNCVDATIEISDEHDIPLMLIASRRQIDSDDFGGGYVENWTTSDFANYVKKNDKRGNIILARDHGGPWQNNIEKDKKMSLSDAMESAKNSYRADIMAGLEVIHIDPSVDNPEVEESLDRIFELLSFCWETAISSNNEIIFEIGTEEQSGSTNTPEELDYTLKRVSEFCASSKIPYPTFVVIQSGTRVMEMRNVGSFESPVRIADELPIEIQVPIMVDICETNDIMMKAHNSDYLSDEALRWHPRLGIHAINVAPEYGVIESLELEKILKESKLHSLLDKFYEISFKSNKWDKWMLRDTKATDRDRSIIAGHYIFAKDEFVDLKKEIENKLKFDCGQLDKLLKDAVKSSIWRYVFNLGLVRRNV